MLKWFLLGLFVWMLWLLRAAVKRRQAQQAAPKVEQAQGQAQSMCQCQQCQVWIPRAEAVFSASGRCFCSTECEQRQR